MHVYLPMPGNEPMAQSLAARAGGELGSIETRRFPDGEAYVRLLSEVKGRDVEIVCTLARPDDQFLSLIFAAETARELGAARVRLVAPYLAYMRQDKRFKDGEAISSVHFARLISASFDSLVTIDPHLHRRRDLSEIFAIPTRVEHAAPLLADWIRAHVENPLVLGPDIESEQWVAAVAERAGGAPYAVSSKTRLGDRQVKVEVPDLSPWRDRRPVLIDDIVSSGRTMIETARELAARGMAKPLCLAVHALFADESYAELKALADEIVSTDTIPHPSNGVSVADLIGPRRN
ncbi:MAG: phosphoribosylpyrophosphate synthetase [Alphaproteobacteria bacterium]|nr:MAG: phosphoribosylpyrophosphate synthetase [Alphaproteobacteria bacterium]